jgi:hypothetical protein
VVSARKAGSPTSPNSTASTACHKDECAFCLYLEKPRCETYSSKDGSCVFAFNFFHGYWHVLNIRRVTSVAVASVVDGF